MIDEHQVREMLQRRASVVPAAATDTRGAVRRARRRLLVNGAVATIAVVALLLVALARLAPPTATVPANPPTKDLGIFGPFAGRILVQNTDDTFEGWVDPAGPVDTMPGPSISQEVTSAVLPIDPHLQPLGWSSDGTQVLLKTTSGGTSLFPMQTLSIVHADGTETPLTQEPIFEITEATLSPDGSRVVFMGDGELDESKLYTFDGNGTPIPLQIPGSALGLPTFSPDGTQMAFLAGTTHEAEVWVANADGTDAHQILTRAPVSFRDATGLTWSPTGDLLAIGVGTHERSGGAIYTFAPDGSGFTKVIDGGSSPSWSPDGSQLAYTIPCDPDPTFTCAQFNPQTGSDPPGLAIADADGSNPRAFGFGVSGPWYPQAPG
jgi:hypothetical protein